MSTRCRSPCSTNLTIERREMENSRAVSSCFFQSRPFDSVPLDYPPRLREQGRLPEWIVCDNAPESPEKKVGGPSLTPLESNDRQECLSYQPVARAAMCAA
ncbi:MAG: hypothetical protein ACE5JO_12325, partial [Candidatus Binatia bacterium]